MRGWRIGTIKGIAIEINWTWAIMFALFTNVFQYLLRQQVTGFESTDYWIAGGLICLLFVASVLLHELCHSLTAISLGIAVKRITLFVFGGVSQVEGEVHTPRGEFLMSIAGPVSSAALAVVLWVISGFHFRLLSGSPDLGTAPDLVAGSLALLSWINMMLAIFNMLPGLPLDGGRVLHSILWGITGNETRSTRTTAGFGMALGIVFMVLGGLQALSGNLSGMWMFFIGWLIQSVARQEGQQAELKHILIGLQVGQVMHWPVTSIPADLTLGAAIQQYAAVRPQPLYPVVDGHGVALGVLAEESLRKTDPSQWGQTTVAQVLEPLDPERMTIGLQAPAAEALTKMARNGQNWLLVTSAENQPIGLVTDGGILAAAQHRRGQAR
jgi:Zn-dependent protease